jgi:hypothetical protein
VATVDEVVVSVWDAFLQLSAKRGDERRFCTVGHCFGNWICFNVPGLSYVNAYLSNFAEGVACLFQVTGLVLRLEDVQSKSLHISTVGLRATVSALPTSDPVSIYLRE